MKILELCTAHNFFRINLTKKSLKFMVFSFCGANFFPRVAPSIASEISVTLTSLPFDICSVLIMKLANSSSLSNSTLMPKYWSDVPTFAGQYCTHITLKKKYAASITSVLYKNVIILLHGWRQLEVNKMDTVPIFPFCIRGINCIAL